MPDISKITLPSGNTYDIKDATARNLISSLGSPTHYIGVTTTEISDGSTASSVSIGPVLHTATAGDIVAYGDREFVWSSTENKWREFGSTGSLKALAFKNAASAEYVPTGSVAAPTVTVTPNTASIKPFVSAGTLPSCTLPAMTATVSDETLTLGWTEGSFNAGALPSAGTAVTVVTGIKAATATAPKFTGTKATITVT